MNFRLTEGHGEAIYWLGVADDGAPLGLSDEHLLASISTLLHLSLQLGVELYIMAVKQGFSGRVAKLLVRRTCVNNDIADIRICACGDAGVGKSTLLGVLISGNLDDGHGKARIFRHRHELEQGLTSSMTRELIGVDSEGKLLHRDILFSSWPQIQEQSEKLIMLVDLAGSHKYLKTTLFGLMSQSPDYVVLTIDGHSGLTATAEEQLSIISALGIPMVIVLTKIDKCSRTHLDKVLVRLSRATRALDSPKEIKPGTSDSLKNWPLELYIPVFPVSCVTGQGMEEFQDFLGGLEKLGHSVDVEPFQFCADEVFNKAVGVVVSGTILRGSVSVGDALLLGPDPDGYYSRVGVTSVQVYRVSVASASAGQAASLALTGISYKQVRKGMVLLSALIEPRSCVKFEAEVRILGSSSLKAGSEPVVFIGTTRQAVKVLAVRSECLSAGEEGLVELVFCHRPEHIEVGESLILRLDDHTKAVGTVIRLIDTLDNLII